MAKFHSQYVCEKCGYSQVGWAGKCPNCGTWGSLIETVITPKATTTHALRGTRPINLSSISLDKTTRISTKISELDRALGGGLVSGQVVLLAGEPGIGKSTILLQVADNMAETLYITGEESANQIANRAIRLGIKSKNIEILEETDVDQIINQVSSVSDSKIGLMIIDSIQTMTTEDLSGMAGSVGQVRECASRLIHFAKANNVPLFIVGQVTKEGTVAGPMSLSHLVDTVLWFEGEKSLSLRILRTVKNRFGPTDEVGIFEMKEKGLISQASPEKLFLTDAKTSVPGSVVTCLMQGNRPILVEIQSLVVPTKIPIPRRVAQGIDRGRFELLLAVLQKKCNMRFFEYDCFVNVAGGIKVFEPASDLAVCLSIVSSFFDKAVPKNLLAIGEVGLLGEIREVVGQERRIKEVKRLGYSTVVSNKGFKHLQQVVHKFVGR